MVKVSGVPPSAAGLKPDTLYVIKANRRTAEYRTAEFRRLDSLCSVCFIKKIEYLPSIFDIRYSIFDIRYSIFDIRYSLFDIRFLKFLLSIKLANFQAGVWADT